LKDADQGQILTTPTVPTKSPTKADFIANADHEAPSPSKPKPGSAQTTTSQKLPQNNQTVKKNNATAKAGKSGGLAEMQPSYADLLPNKTPSMKDLGSGEFVDGNLPEGISLDVNTHGSRMISYFTKLKQAIQLAIHDPSAAELAADPTTRGRSRLSGKSSVLMVIERDGSLSKVQVVDSSEHHAMDRFWLEVLRSASPFPPLPADYKEKELRLVYSLNYAIEMSAAGGAPRVSVF
jgi:TonB family protein